MAIRVGAPRPRARARGAGRARGVASAARGCGGVGPRGRRRSRAKRDYPEVCASRFGTGARARSARRAAGSSGSKGPRRSRPFGSSRRGRPERKALREAEGMRMRSVRDVHSACAVDLRAPAGRARPGGRAAPPASYATRTRTRPTPGRLLRASFATGAGIGTRWSPPVPRWRRGTRSPLRAGCSPGSCAGSGARGVRRAGHSLGGRSRRTWQVAGSKTQSVRSLSGSPRRATATSVVDCVRRRVWVRGAKCASHRGCDAGTARFNRGETLMKEGSAALALHRPSRPENIGGVMRAAEVYGVELVVLGGGVAAARYPLGHPTDTTRAWRNGSPWCSRTASSMSCPRGVCLSRSSGWPRRRRSPEFEHPESAAYVFGPENGALDEAMLARCPHVVSIPGHECSNLAAAVNVVLYARTATRWDAMRDVFAPADGRLRGRAGRLRGAPRPRGSFRGPREESGDEACCLVLVAPGWGGVSREELFVWAAFDQFLCEMVAIRRSCVTIQVRRHNVVTDAQGARGARTAPRTPGRTWAFPQAPTPRTRIIPHPFVAVLIRGGGTPHNQGVPLCQSGQYNRLFGFDYRGRGPPLFSPCDHRRIRVGSTVSIALASCLDATRRGASAVLPRCRCFEVAC